MGFTLCMTPIEDSGSHAQCRYPGQKHYPPPPTPLSAAQLTFLLSCPSILHVHLLNVKLIPSVVTDISLRSRTSKARSYMAAAAATDAAATDDD